MRYRGKRETKRSTTVWIVSGVILAGILALVCTTLLSDDHIPENTNTTMAAAALPTVSAAEKVEKATETRVATATSATDMSQSVKATDSAIEATEKTDASVGKAKTVGIVNTSDVNMRDEPSTGEVLMTLGKGTAVVVVGESDGWCQVAYNEKTGYIASRFLDVKAKADLSCTGKIIADALNVRAFPGTSSSIVCQAGEGAYVDVTGFENGWFAVTTNYGSGYANAEYIAIGVTKPAAKATTSPVTEAAQETEQTSVTTTYSGNGAALAATAQQYLGYSYSYGGSGPSSFDCSGFTMYIYSLYGVSLPHGATGQMGYGTAVSQSELQPGDLVFFSYGGNAIGHVGIYIGDRNFIHASTYGVGVIISSLDGGSYPSRYVGARRIF